MRFFVDTADVDQIRKAKKERTKKEDDEALNANVAEKFLKDTEE